MKYIKLLPIVALVWTLHAPLTHTNDGVNALPLSQNVAIATLIVAGAGALNGGATFSDGLLHGHLDKMVQGAGTTIVAMTAGTIGTTGQISDKSVIALLAGLLVVNISPFFAHH